MLSCQPVRPSVAALARVKVAPVATKLPGDLEVRLDALMREI
jgi:hypothetical protein